LTKQTVVVWPEHLGTWLVTTGEALAVHESATLSRAMRALAVRHPLGLLWGLLASPEPGKLTAALFRLQARATVRRYQALFSQLAQDYGVTMVAGSIVLPAPQVSAGQIEVGRGPLYNVAAVFRSDGTPYPELVRKAHPVGSELPFTTAGDPAALPVFDTPAGRLGVLICADAWFPACYARLRAQDAELVAVPSYAATPGVWDAPWQGYDGAQIPEDVDPQDVGRLTEAQAWQRYALAGRMAQSGAEAGINVFLGGALWDLGGEGASLMLRAGEPPMLAEPGRPALLNLWL
jgi:predicted amidohydrolase